MANEINRSEKIYPPPFGKSYWFGPAFDPHKSFLHLPCFWWPFTIILFLSVLAGWKVVIDNELVFGVSPRLEQWYEWFKIPLWILALLIPVLGLLNANHKSEQARAQMELTKAQNKFSNYYKHIEEFEKHCKSVLESYNDKVYFANARSLYHHIFDSSKEPVVMHDHIEALLSLYLNDIINDLESFTPNASREDIEKSILKTFKGYNFFTKRFGDQIGIRPEEQLDKEFPMNRLSIGNKNFTIAKGEIAKQYEHFICLGSLAHRIFEFDHDYIKHYQSEKGSALQTNLEHALELINRIEGGMVYNMDLASHPVIPPEDATYPFVRSGFI